MSNGLYNGLTEGLFGETSLKPIKSGIAYNRPILTGQSTIYRTGDDGWNLANNVYLYTPPTNPISIAKLDKSAVSPFTTLLYDNAFGNKDRYTDSLGTQDYGSTGSSLSDYVIDHLTGLGWHNAGVDVNYTWNDAIDGAIAKTTHFTDWRLANISEFMSISDIENGGMNYSPFNRDLNIWTSTTRKAVPGQGFFYFLTLRVPDVSDKTTANRKRMYCRNHYN